MHGTLDTTRVMQNMLSHLARGQGSADLFLRVLMPRGLDEAAGEPLLTPFFTAVHPRACARDVMTDVSRFPCVAFSDFNRAFRARCSETRRGWLWWPVSTATVRLVVATPRHLLVSKCNASSTGSLMVRPPLQMGGGGLHVGRGENDEGGQGEQEQEREGWRRTRFAAEARRWGLISFY